MRSVLIAFDGSSEAEAVLRRVIRDARAGEVGRIHLLNVQTPLGGYVSQFVGSRAVREFQQDAGAAALAPGERLLEAAGCDYRTHVRVGDAARVIVHLAERLGVDQVVMGPSGPGWLGKLMQYLLIARVIRRASVPVVILAAEPRRLGLGMPIGGSRPTFPR